MINGRKGQIVAIVVALALVAFICLRVLLLVAKQGGAAMSLDNVIALLTGGVMGAAGVNVTPAPAAPLVLVQPATVTPPAVIVNPPEATHTPWLFDPMTGDKL